MKEEGEIGVNFENFIKYKLPNLLHLSPAKQAHLEIIFYHFSDFVRPLASKAPQEFSLFFNELQGRMKKVSKKRSPRGMRVDLTSETFLSGRRRHRIAPRIKKIK